MNKVTIQVKRITPTAILPKYATEGASCMDVYADGDGMVPVGCSRLIPTGISVAIPPGYEIQVRSRSGLALKKGIFVLNSPGTIDSDYRGEIGIILHNAGDQPLLVAKGDRIAQIGVYPVVQAEWDDVLVLDSTERGTGGFGSTGT